MKCKCLSAPDYHREDCLLFDVYGNKKILTINQIKDLNPSRKNPIKIISDFLVSQIKSECPISSFPYIYSEVSVIGIKGDELILIGRNGRETYLFCDEEGSSIYYNRILNN